jgi:hypothetical protein
MQLIYHWKIYLPSCYDYRFSVDLACGSTPESDVAFHLNPRFDQNHVVRNSRLGGQWGPEECSASQRNPFQRGAKFYLIILAAADGFMVIMLCDFVSMQNRLAKIIVILYRLRMSVLCKLKAVTATG